MNKCVILSDNAFTPSTRYRTLLRNLGAMEVDKRFRQHGYDSTILEWVSEWSKQELLESICTWFKGSEKQVIGFSTPFCFDIVYELETLLEEVRQQYPGVTVIVGGMRNHDSKLEKIVDYVFVGRSMEILDAWLSDSDMHQFATSNPQVLINRNIKFEHDLPVVPDIDDGYILNENDILGFEIGIGCKFNCAFCNYDLRNTKNPLLEKSENIQNFMQHAYDKYGVKNFFIADDTLNDQDDKLEALATAVESLSFEPNISCYLRVDLFESKPKQYELLKRCNLKGITLGIETMNPVAAKRIHKSTKNVETALNKFKEYAPNAFINTGYIIGLSGDNEIDIRANIKRLIKDQLVHSISPSCFMLQDSVSELFDDNFMCEISKYPEKYGYTFDGYDNTFSDTIVQERAGGGVNTVYWKNEWCDSKQATELAEDINSYFVRNHIPTVSGFEWIILLALGVTKDISEHGMAGYNRIWHSDVLAKTTKHKRDYVEKKKSFILTQKTR